MRKYKATFTGREAGAIGICYKITDTVKAVNQYVAREELSEKYEHITELELKEIK